MNGVFKYTSKLGRTPITGTLSCLELYIYRPQILLNENYKEILMHFLMLFNIWKLIVNLVVLLQEIVKQICANEHENLSSFFDILTSSNLFFE